MRTDRSAAIDSTAIANNVLGDPTSRYALWFSFGLLIFPYVFYPIIGFGKAVYDEPAQRELEEVFAQS